MRNLLIMMLAGLLLISTAAHADDWDDDPVMKDAPTESDDTRREDPAEVEIVAPHTSAAAHMGMYFGADGHFEHGFADGYSRDRAVDYQGQTIYFPEYGRSDSQLYENVYGPMWGVPADAVGMEGYDPYYYYLMTLADPSQLTAEQRRDLEERMRGTHQRQTESGEVIHERDEVDEFEGINMSDDYWD